MNPVTTEESGMNSNDKEPALNLAAELEKATLHRVMGEVEFQQNEARNALIWKRANRCQWASMFLIAVAFVVATVGLYQMMNIGFSAFENGWKYVVLIVLVILIAIVFEDRAAKRKSLLVNRLLTTEEKIKIATMLKQQPKLIPVVSTWYAQHQQLRVAELQYLENLKRMADRTDKEVMAIREIENILQHEPCQG